MKRHLIYMELSIAVIFLLLITDVAIAAGNDSLTAEYPTSKIVEPIDSKEKITVDEMMDTQAESSNEESADPEGMTITQETIKPVEEIGSENESVINETTSSEKEETSNEKTNETTNIEKENEGKIKQSPFDSRLDSVGNRTLPESLSGDEIGTGYPNLYNDDDWWEHINNLVMRRYIENWMNDLSKRQHLGYREGDQIVIDLNNLFKNGGRPYYDADLRAESPTMAGAISNSPGSGEMWFVIDAADTIPNSEKSTWLKRGWRSANNTSGSGYVKALMTNTPKSGTSADGTFSWAINSVTQKMTITRQKTRLEPLDSQSVISFGRVDYNNSINTKDWTGSKWEARAGEKREGYFYPKLAVHLKSAEPLKLNQKDTPKVRVGEKISQVISADFKWRDYIDVSGVHPDSTLKMTVVDEGEYFSKNQKTVKLKVTESLDDQTRSETIELAFDVANYQLEMKPVTNLARELTKDESVADNTEVSKLESPMTDKIKYDLELDQKGVKKTGKYSLSVSISGEGLVDSETNKPTSIINQLGTSEKDVYSVNDYLKDKGIAFVAGKPVKFTLGYTYEDGTTRTIAELGEITPLDATPPTGELQEELATIVNEIPKPEEALASFKDDTTDIVKVTYLSDIEGAVSEESTIKDGVVNLKEVAVELKDEAGNTHQLNGEILAVLAEKIWLEVPQSSISLDSEELIVGAKDLPKPIIMPKRERITDEDLVKLLIEKGVKGYYYEKGEIQELLPSELDIFGVSDISYHPTGFIDDKNLKVTGHHKDMVTKTEPFGVYIVDGKFELNAELEMQFDSKLSTKTTNQTELSTKTGTDLFVIDEQYSADGWKITAKASEFITNDGKQSVVPVSDMDLMVRIAGEADQSLITNGGISIENTTDKRKFYKLSDKKSDISMYLTTTKSQRWAKINTTYSTTIDWEFSRINKLPEAQFLVPKAKKGVD